MSTANNGSTAYRSWDLGRAVLFGIVLGAMFSVMQEIAGGEAFPGANNLEIVLYMMGRLFGLALLFAAIALVRNVIVRSRWKARRLS